MVPSTPSLLLHQQPEQLAGSAHCCLEKRLVVAPNESNEETLKTEMYNDVTLTTNEIKQNGKTKEVVLPVWGLRKQNYFFGYSSSENQAHKAQTPPTMRALPAGPTNQSTDN